MKQRNRYDLNAGGRRPARSLAKSPRTQPARVSVTGGTGGQAVSGGANQTHTVGQAGAGDGARTRKQNTMAKSRDGGMPITYYAPMERWVGTTARTSVHAPARTANRAWEVDGSHEKALAAGESAGLRADAMQRHSILRTTGAVDIRRRPEDTPDTAPAYLQAGQVGPVWHQETNEIDHARYGAARDTF